MSAPRRVRRVESRSARKRGRRRLPWLLVLATFVAVAGLLGYGLIERNVLRPKVDARVERTDLYVKAGETIQVNVINACGVNGMAQKFTEFLRARRFDVPEYGTSTTIEPRSRVIDRIGDPLSAQKVAYALGIPPERIDTEIDSSLFLRATVIIGRDFRTLRPMN